MSDMLVKLYTLPELAPAMAQQTQAGIVIRRALPPEKHLIVAWINTMFQAVWASECDVALTRQPPSCFLAIDQGMLCGFACYDATCKNFFGPTGVSEAYQGRGIGKALLLSCLHAMRAEGYAYAIIGGVGPAAFYQKTVGAIEIEGSTPGIYDGLLKGS
jgi:GNAT superfamily N-acetyltransferase